LAMKLEHGGQLSNDGAGGALFDKSVDALGHAPLVLQSPAAGKYVARALSNEATGQPSFIGELGNAARRLGTASDGFLKSQGLSPEMFADGAKSFLAASGAEIEPVLMAQSK